MRNSLFQNDYVCKDGKIWICHTCDRSLQKGKLPTQARANGLQLKPIPEELCGLNALEVRMIARRIPFMKL